MNLDNPTVFNSVLSNAVNLGITHVGVNIKRVKAAALMTLLSNRFGALTYRNFHREILNRAYGLAFTNALKMSWVRARGL